MAASTLRPGSAVIIHREDFDHLFDALRDAGYTIVGPTLRDSAIVYDELTSAGDLPAGWTDHQDAGHYRIARRHDQALFGYNVGPHSWKKFLFPSRQLLWRAHRREESFEITGEADTAIPKYAFLGVRACELQAIAIQDKIFTQGPYVDTPYQSRREKAFLIAVNCGQAGGTCFCASMQTGPRATKGFDWALTEIIREKDHYFLVEAGSERGAQLLRPVPHRPATDTDLRDAAQITEATTRQMGRRMDTQGLKELLYESHDSPRWEEVAGRCLSCSNCTLVCPTCFCHTVEDVTDLQGDISERWRTWDSCFTVDFSYIHGGSIRPSVSSRYRQWITHKLASWIDQFGSWVVWAADGASPGAPAAIDITQEVAALRQEKEEQTMYPTDPNIINTERG